MKAVRAVRGLLVPLMPGMPRVELVRFTDDVVPGIGMVEPYDFAPGLRMYMRFHRPKAGTVDGFRANAVASALVRSADPEAGLVFERVVIVGRSRDGTLADVPLTMVRKARRLWLALPRPSRIVPAQGAPLHLRSQVSVPSRASDLSTS